MHCVFIFIPRKQTNPIPLIEKWNRNWINLLENPKYNIDHALSSEFRFTSADPGKAVIYLQPLPQIIKSTSTV